MNKFMKQLKKRMNERVQSAVECLQDARVAAKRADYGTSAMVLEIARLSGLDIKDHYITARFSESYGDQTTLCFTVNCSDGLKTKGLTAMIAYLSEYAGEAGCSDHTSDWSASRSFDFGNWEDTFQVNMQCNIPTDAKGCRKVAVGEEVKTVTQYRIECDSDKI
jgi:hypothetical protein